MLLFTCDIYKKYRAKSIISDRNTTGNVKYVYLFSLQYVLFIMCKINLKKSTIHFGNEFVYLSAWVW